MSPMPMHELVFPLLIGAAVAAAAPLGAQGPAVELEGYYYAQALPQAICAAPPAPQVEAYAGEAAQPPHDHADAVTADHHGESVPLVAQINADPTLNLVTRR
jgi:hypothetical protein